MQSVKRIAILLSGRTAHYRLIVEGVVEYARHLDWEFNYEPRGSSLEGLSADMARSLMQDWSPDGIITNANERPITSMLKRYPAPAVNLSTNGSRLGFYSVLCDHAGLGRLAAQYFIDRRYANLAYVGIDTAYCDDQWKSFSRVLARAGLACERLLFSSVQPSGWRSECEQMSDWLRALPKPLAVLVYGASRACDAIRACRGLGLSVPQDVAVMTTGDEMECQMSPVPVSCIDMPSHRVGIEAGRLLHQLMLGRLPKRRIRVIRPIGVIDRRSTDATAIEDPAVRRAAQFIVQHEAQPLTVKGLVQALNVSRRVLESRFRKAMGCSPYDFIERTHLGRAKRLLVQTDLQIKAIARSCGYANSEVFSVAFRRQFGTTATQFRHDHATSITEERSRRRKSST